MSVQNENSPAASSTNASKMEQAHNELNWMGQPTVYVVESPTSRCYTSFLCHSLEYGGVDVLTVDADIDNRLEAIMECIRNASAVIIAGRPEPDMAVVAGIAYAIGRRIVHLHAPDDLTSENLKAIVDTFVPASDDGPAELWGSLQPED